MDGGNLVHTCFWILTVYALSLKSAQSTHYTGGSVSWRPGQIYPEDNITEVLIDFRVSWRTSFLEQGGCSQEDIDYHGIEFEDDYQNFWTCESGCDGKQGFEGVICSEFDVEDDWSSGSLTLPFNITGIQEFNIQFSGCCWISTVYIPSSATASSWNLPISGSLGLRSDTGKPNRSPISAATPVIRFQAGCPDMVDLPLYDDDGDTVACRLAHCSEVSCLEYPYLKVTQQGKTCRLSYNAGGPGNTLVPISLKVEDYPNIKDLKINGTLVDPSVPLSSVALQFIVRLFEDDHACKLRPTWQEPTFPNGFVKAAVLDEPLVIVLNISSESPLNTVSVVGPRGITKSVIENHGTSTDYSMTLNLIPVVEHLGTHMICTTAKDINGKMSEHRCMTLIVGEEQPCGIENGGCSDVCTPTGVSYVCGCTRACWRLAEDRRTCMPVMTIDCHPDHFAVSLPVCAIGQYSIEIGFHDQFGVGPDPKCEADKIGQNYVKNIQYDECFTQKEEDFTEIHFKNQLRTWIDDEDTFQGSGQEPIIITRGFWYNIQLVCSFNKYSNVNASFRPQDQEEGQVLVPGLGSFQFFFDFYMDEEFKAAYSPYEYPITVTVNSDIYFGIRTIGATGLEVFTEKCVAMTTATPTENTLSYTMIEEGCIEDPTLLRYSGPNTLEDRFSIKAFKFQDNLNTDSSVNIYIQCSAVLCVTGESDTRCQRGCIRSRKRRGVNDEIFVEHSIDSRSKRETGEDEDPTVATNISESGTFDIRVSGPFRIEVVQTEGNPPVTVVTPTNLDNTKTTPKPTKTNSETQTTTTTTTKKTEEESSKESFIVVVIASSVGGVVVIVLLFLLVGLILYYHISLKPRHKVLPDKDSMGTARTLSAWTIDEEEEYPRPYFPSGGKTPPPSFWEVQQMDT